MGDHISDACKKGVGKVNALAKIAPFIGLFKTFILINTFFNSQFPLICLCHSRTNGKKINKLHEMLTYYLQWEIVNTSRTTRKDDSVFIQIRNTEYLTIIMLHVNRKWLWMFQTKSESYYIWFQTKCFKQKNFSWYNLRQISEFSRPLVRSLYHGLESALFLRLNIWDMLRSV